MKRVLAFLFLFITTIHSQKFEVAGLISDAETGKPLSFANIRIDETTNGTASNYDGFYSIKLTPGNYKLVFSYIGYKSEIIPVNIPISKKLNVKLKPDAIKLGEVIVNANEDPAYRIIREAIKRKKENRKGLNNFEFNAYSKMIIKSAGDVAVIEESFLKGYNKIDDWEKEFILSTRKTENQNQTSSIKINLTNSYYSDFSRDTLTVIMNKIFLPLADNAFDYYDYKLLGVTTSSNGDIYKIKVIPLSNIQPLMQGEITIENSMYALNSINLEINKGVRFPFVNDLSVKFVQQLGKYYGYWLPNYVESNAGFEINFQGLLGAEKMEFNLLNSITEYKINEAIPDSIEYAKTSKYGGYTCDTTGHERSPIILSKNDINDMRPIPLTAAEVEAYTSLDSSKTLDKMIKVTGALASLIPKPGTKIGTSNKDIFSTLYNLASNYLIAYNNRVNGIVIGPHYNGYLFKNKLMYNISSGYAFQRKKLQGEIGLNYSFKKFFINEFEAKVYHTTRPWQMITPYNELYNSVGVTLGFDDQFNYYLSTGFELGIHKIIAKNFSAKLEFITEEEKSLPELRYQSIFKSNRTPRINPVISEGSDRRLTTKIFLGKNPLEIKFIPEDGLFAQVDFSNPSFASDFNYKRFSISGLINVKTFYDELFIAPYLQLILNAGIVTGNFGQQHLFSHATALGFYSPAGVIKGLNPYTYSGTEIIELHAEHNWRTIPFQSLGLDFISNLHLDFITGASVFKTWNNSTHTISAEMKKPYWEIYAAISRILGVLRINVGYNSQKNISVTAGIGTLL